MGLGIFDSFHQDLPHQRYNPLPVGATILGNQLPSILSNGIAAGAMLSFGLSSRPKATIVDNNKDKSKDTKQPRLSGPIKAVMAMILLTTVLLTEVLFIWVVSATYKPSQQLSH